MAALFPRQAGSRTVTQQREAITIILHLNKLFELNDYGRRLGQS